MKRRHTRMPAQRGLTLLELLLTVVIFSLVITVFSQAIFQVGVFERASARSMGGWQRAWAQGFALDDYFRAQLIPPEAQDPVAVGGPLTYRSWWVEQAGPLAGRPVQATLNLRQMAPGSREWGLFLQGAAGIEQQLAQWDHPVSLRYVDAQGRVTDVWPGPGAPARVAEGLPRAVRLLDDKLALVHQWSFPGMSQPALVRSGNTTLLGSGATP